MLNIQSQIFLILRIFQFVLLSTFPKLNPNKIIKGTITQDNSFTGIPIWVLCSGDKLLVYGCTDFTARMRYMEM